MATHSIILAWGIRRGSWWAFSPRGHKELYTTVHAQDRGVGGELNLSNREYFILLFTLPLTPDYADSKVRLSESKFGLKHIFAI